MLNICYQYISKGRYIFELVYKIILKITNYE